MTPVIFERFTNAMSGNFYTVVTSVSSPNLRLENFNLDTTVDKISFNIGIGIYRSDATS